MATSTDPVSPDCSSSCLKEVGDEVHFQDFCGLLEKISSTSGSERKKSVLEKFIRQWREAHAKLHPSDSATTTDTFFSAMRLLLPQLDRQRPAYGMKETALAKHYIDILSIAKESSDAQKLLNYRAPHAAKQDAGDFASVAYFVLRNRCPEKGSLTLSQINQYLDQLALSNVKRDRAGVKKALQMLLRNTSAQEQKWLIRIIMKELKTGVNENSVLSVFHPDAVDLFSVTSSLDKVCSDLRDPSTRLNEAAISYFIPFRPMLGQRAPIDQVVRLMEHQPFYIETKFDGERIQLHKQENKYMYFSRSSKDYTSSFGGSDKEGSFTPNIHQAFNSKVHSCILDGEMVGWDSETESYLPKGDHIDVKTLLPNDERGTQPCFVVFDILMINDINLANCPLKERVEHLNKVFEPVKGYIQLVERVEKNTKDDVIAALNDAIDKREEGLIVKQPSSFYRPDKRKGSGWLKIKPEYVDSLTDQLDLLIVGGYFGVGRRSGMISHFMCAVAVPPRIPGEKPMAFHSFCKVGSGYSLHELRELGHKMKPHWHKFDTKNPPESIILAPGFKEKPDLWIDPKNSKIVQIKAAEIIVSDKYKCGCTLRFPRLEAVREDKEWYDCMTVDELEEMKQNEVSYLLKSSKTLGVTKMKFQLKTSGIWRIVNMSGSCVPQTLPVNKALLNLLPILQYEIASGHLAHHHLEDEGEGLPSLKKRKVGNRVERPRGVAAQFRQTDVTDVQQVSSMFDGMEFCVVNGSSSFTKKDIETKIAENGGTFVQNPTPNTCCVLVDKVVVKATNIISKRTFDVVKIQWLIDCLEAGSYLPYTPSHMIHTSNETRLKFSEMYDKYGDSFIEDTDEQQLREVFSKVEEMSNQRKFVCPQAEIAIMEGRYYPDDTPYGIFRQCRFYIDKYQTVNDASTAIHCCPLELTELECRLYGGRVSCVFDEHVTHVVFDKSDLKRVGSLRKIERGRVKKAHFVLSPWVTDSIEETYMKNERLYEPKTS